MTQVRTEALVLNDIRRISKWLAEDVENQEAQGAASDLNAALVALGELYAAAERFNGSFPDDEDRSRLQAAVAMVREGIES